MYLIFTPGLLLLIHLTIGVSIAQGSAYKRNVVCLSFEPSTVFLPTTYFVTAYRVEDAFSTQETVSLPLSTAIAVSQKSKASLSPEQYKSEELSMIRGSSQSIGTKSESETSCRHIPETGNKSINQALHTGLGSGSIPAPATDNKRLISRNMLYLTNWGSYQPRNLPVDHISHVLYAFGDIKENGTVISSDPYPDTEKHYKNDVRNDTGNNAFGAIQQLFALKKEKRSLKTLLSIGGWTYSQAGKFSNFAGSDEGRKCFAASAVKLIADWGMDGIDIDWEYPADATEALNFVEVLKETRRALDSYAAKNNQKYHYQLTVAASAGPKHYHKLDLKAMDQYIDTWHLMAYDYSGSWDTTTGHQTNINKDTSNIKSTKFDTEQAVEDYIGAGIAPNKIVLGHALYGRSFADTDGLGEAYHGVGGGSKEKGIWLYHDLLRPSAEVKIDKKVGAAWSYDHKSRELVSYDNVDSIRLKAEYIQSKSLGGAFFWEAAGDKMGEGSLVGTMAGYLGNLQSSQNMLQYPESQYDNIKKALVL